MEHTPDTQPSQPDPSPHEDAIIRDIMEVNGISYAEARKEWDTMKAESNKQVLDKKSEDE